MYISKVKSMPIIDEIILKQQVDNLSLDMNHPINRIFKNDILFEWIKHVINNDKMSFIFENFENYIEIANSYKYLNYNEHDIFSLYQYRNCGYFVFQEERTAFYKYTCSVLVILKVPEINSRIKIKHLEKIINLIQDNKYLISRYCDEAIYQDMIRFKISDFARTSYSLPPPGRG